jgi:hypothetical protein
MAERTVPQGRVPTSSEAPATALPCYELSQALASSKRDGVKNSMAVTKPFGGKSESVVLPLLISTIAIFSMSLLCSVVKVTSPQSARDSNPPKASEKDQHANFTLTRDRFFCSLGHEVVINLSQHRLNFCLQQFP